MIAAVDMSSDTRCDGSQNDLEFGLRMQEYIELCRKRATPAALAYLHKHIAPWRDTHFKVITHAIALLAYDDTTSLAPYQVRTLPRPGISVADSPSAEPLR